MQAIPLHRVLNELEEKELPCFIYDPEALTRNIATVRAHFPNYHYPVKCNPHPALLRSALVAGAELDLCSEGDLLIATALGAVSRATSFTGTGLTTKVMQQLAASGCRVNLNSLDEVAAWADCTDAAKVGVRIELTAASAAYRSKFGLGAAEIERARRLVQRIVGIHVHDTHRGRSPEEAARLLGLAFEDIPSMIIEDLEYVCLGGGWPHAYEGETAWRVADVASAFQREIEEPLRRRGFAGEILVEPGEVVTAPIGVWLARVMSVKIIIASSGRIVTLDTPTPIPCADLTCPLQLLRSADGRYEVVESERIVTCAVYGASNTGRDCIRRHVRLPEPKRGDIVAICDAGAYVRSLISAFNERTPPAAYCLSL